MNKNVKAIIVIAVVLVVAFLVYKFAFKSKFKKGYAKKSGDWVACGVEDYDKDYYKGTNTSGLEIYFKKSDVNTRPSKSGGTATTLCADAAKSMNIYTLK